MTVSHSSDHGVAVTADSELFPSRVVSELRLGGSVLAAIEQHVHVERARGDVESWVGDLLALGVTSVESGGEGELAVVPEVVVDHAEVSVDVGLVVGEEELVLLLELVSVVQLEEKGEGVVSDHGLILLGLVGWI